MTLSLKPQLASLTRIIICRSGTIMATERNIIFRFSGSSWRPAYPGFIVMNIPNSGFNATVSPSLNTNDVFFSRRAISTILEEVKAKMSISLHSALSGILGRKLRYLLRGDGQNWQFNTIEFIEASPATALGQAFENSSETSEVHLI